MAVDLAGYPYNNILEGPDAFGYDSNLKTSDPSNYPLVIAYVYSEALDTSQVTDPATDTLIPTLTTTFQLKQTTTVRMTSGMVWGKNGGSTRNRYYLNGVQLTGASPSLTSPGVWYSWSGTVNSDGIHSGGANQEMLNTEIHVLDPGNYTLEVREQMAVNSNANSWGERYLMVEALGGLQPFTGPDMFGFPDYKISANSFVQPYVVGYVFENRVRNTAGNDVTTDTRVPGMACTFTIPLVSDVKFSAYISGVKTGPNTGERCRFYLDGVQLTKLAAQTTTGGNAWSTSNTYASSGFFVSMTEVHRIAAGTHTIEVQGQATGSVATVIWAERCLLAELLAQGF